MAEEGSLRYRFTKRAQDALRRARAGYNTVSSSAREFWRGSDPKAAPPPGAPSAAGAAQQGQPRANTGGRGSLRRWGLRVGAGALAAVPEAVRLADIGQTQGRDAVMEELPRSGGRIAGTLAGLGAGARVPGPWQLRTAATLGLGAAGAIGGEELVNRAERYIRGSAPARKGSSTSGGDEYPLTAPDGRKYRWGGGEVPQMEFAPQSSSGRTLKPGDPWKPGDPVPIIEASDLPRSQRERDMAAARAARERYAQAEAPRNAPRERVVADPNTAPEVRGITRRTTADIERRTGRTRDIITGALLNPNGNEAELLRRAINDARFHGRGSPSMRRAIMEAYIGRMDNADRASIAGMSDGNQAAARGADNEFAANEAFADRRRRAAQFNVETAETRRQNDAENLLRASEIAAGISRRGGSGAAAKDPDQSFVDQIYQQLTKEGVRPAVAAEGAARAAIDAGLPVDDHPITRWGVTRRADRLYEGAAEYGDRWFGLGPPSDFDYATAVPYAQTLGQRIISYLPGGEDPGDIRWVDAQGNEAITAPWVLGGESPTRERRSLFRERLARGEE